MTCYCDHTILSFWNARYSSAVVNNFMDMVLKEFMQDNLIVAAFLSNNNDFARVGVDEFDDDS